MNLKNLSRVKNSPFRAASTGLLPAASILIVCLACQDANEVVERVPANNFERTPLKKVLEIVDPHQSSIRLTFGFRDGEEGLALMVCESLEAGEQLKGKRLKMKFNTLREGEYEGDEGTHPDGMKMGSSSNPQFFEIPTATGISITEVECLGKVPYAYRLSVEWGLTDENDLTVVVRSSVYRVSATADRIITIVEENNQFE